MRAALALAALTLAALVALFALRIFDAPRVAPVGAAGGAPNVREVRAPAPDAQPQPAERRAIESAALDWLTADKPEGEAAAARAPLVRGRVVDDAGEPVAGARVLASDRPGFPLDASGVALPVWESTTGGAGRFVLRGPAPGPLRLALRAPGFAPRDEDALPLPDRDEHDLGTLVLERGVVLTGVVVDPLGRGVAGARLVRVEPGLALHRALLPALVERAIATTRDDGSFVVDELAAGPWTLRVESEAHPVLEVAGVAPAPGARVDGLVVRLEPGDTIEGVVAGVPASERGALRVEATPKGAEATERVPLVRSAAVAGDGSFELRGLAVGRAFLLRAVAAPGGQAVAPLARARSEPVVAWAGARGVRIDYWPQSVLVVRASDAASGEPIPTFDVEVRLGLHAWRARADGSARIGGLRPQGAGERASVSVRALGYRDWTREGVSIPSGAEVELTDVRLAPVPIVRVRVVDAAGRAPVAGARVELRAVPPASEEASRGATTDEGGVARISSLPGPRILRVSHPAYAPYAAVDALAPTGRTIEREVAVSRGGRVDVRVASDRDRAPLAGRWVEHRPPDTGADGESSAARATDAEGVATFEHLTAGLHAFRVRPSRGVVAADEAWITLALAAGAQVELDLVARPPASLRGRVSEGGVALEGATLGLQPAAGSATERLLAGWRRGAAARTGADGLYRFDAIEPGEYTLSIEHATRRMPVELEHPLEPGPNELDVDLDVAIVEGRVVDSVGAPLAGIRVRARRSSPAPDAGDRPVALRFGLVGADAANVLTLGADSAPAARTDADGRYRLRGVEPGVALVVSASGEWVRGGAEGPMRVEPNGVRVVDFALERAGAIEVAVARPGGGLAPLCVVRATRAGQESAQPRVAFAQAAGVTLDGLSPGVWTVAVEPAGRTSAPSPPEQRVEVVAGVATRVAFELP